jgi:hypothetical protein
MSFGVSRATALALLVAIGGSGCATDVKRTPVSLSTPSGERARIEVAEAATVESSSGYNRVLPAGSVWELAGRLPQGAVYKRVKDVFTIEGAHVHEAYLVVSGNQLVGYYLPVERAFSPAKPVTLSLK